MKHTIRNYRSGDIPGITRVVNAADRFYALENGASESEIADELARPGLNVGKDIFVAEDGSDIVGIAIGRMASSEEEDSYRTWLAVDPRVREQGLEDDLLECLYGRALELLPSCKAEQVRFNTIANSNQLDMLAAIARAGMNEVRRGWTMVCDTLDSVADAKFPDGIRVRPYRTGDDDVSAHQADTEIFRDHWGHTDEPLEHWLHLVSNLKFKPDLSLVAQDAATEEIAGFCIVVINDDENARLGVKRGWIEILGVRRAFRRKGLGTALLLTGMHHIRDAHMDQAALGCDAENVTGATRIYKRVGFRVHRERIIFSKPMSRYKAA